MDVFWSIFYRGTEWQNKHPKLDEIDHPILDGKHLHPNLDDLIIQIRMKVTVVNIIQNWMTLIIQIRMKVTVVNNIQNICGG